MESLVEVDFDVDGDRVVAKVDDAVDDLITHHTSTSQHQKQPQKSGNNECRDQYGH